MVLRVEKPQRAYLSGLSDSVIRKKALPQFEPSTVREKGWGHRRYRRETWKKEKAIQCTNDKYFSDWNMEHGGGGCCPNGEPKHTLFYDSKTQTSQCCLADASYFKDWNCIMERPNLDPTSSGPTPSTRNGYAERTFVPQWEGPGHRIRQITASRTSRIFLSATTTTTTSGRPTTPTSDNFLSAKAQMLAPRAKLWRKRWFCCQRRYWQPTNERHQSLMGLYWHKSCPTDARKAKEFRAQKYCTTEGCGVCLRGFNKGVRHTCPGNQAIVDKNSLVCMPLMFKKVSCLADNPVPKPTKAGNEELQSCFFICCGCCTFFFSKARFRKSILILEAGKWGQMAVCSSIQAAFMDVKVDGGWSTGGLAVITVISCT